MNHIKKLGLSNPHKEPTQRTVAIRQAVYHAGLSTPRANIAAKPKTRPSDHPDPAVQHKVAGLIGELSAGAVMIDHATRGLVPMGLFRHEAKRALNELVKLSDTLIAAMQAQFDMEDADATNAISDALGLCGEKFCQLNPAQMDAVLRHMDEMIRLNIAYVPSPTTPDSSLS
ncbi:hypothetical protein DNI29_04315 [Hymenobacter sediminis]|uniref:hypothetical protein n=1 Tax=Hymenobacter sediminis TaxID=2218621 RepID=UPI000DA66195|nr:hypothetical protein [Hymenobacter sediminis]RPD50027.1 hypothetical protein DNI29_04315 [Hymenobacter sediminis]